MEHIRKIIREALSRNFIEEVAGLPKELPYLQAFELKKVYKKDNGFMVAKFILHTKNYIIHFFVKRNIDTTWSANMKVYWKRLSVDFSHGAGKDYDYSFGTYATREEMIEALNNKLKNNFMFDTGMYQDDYDLKMDVIILKYLNSIKSKIKDIITLRNTEHFLELEKVYEKIKELDEEGMLRFVESEYPESEDKQTCILLLQRVEKVEFYSFLEAMKGF